MKRVSLQTKYLPFLILGLVLIAVIAALMLGGSSGKPKKANLVQSTSQASACGAYRDDRNVIIDGQTIKAETPNSPAAFEKGLAGRPCILPDQGMLFVFTKEGRYPFWMKGMKFPLDIVWITAQKKVAAIEIDEQPSTYPDQFVNQIPAQYVLELKADRSKQLHMAIGTSVEF